METKTKEGPNTTISMDEDGNLPLKDICVTDKYYITYLTCLVVGAGSLLPYTGLLSVADYFQSKHPDINIMLWLNTPLNICNFACIALLIPFNHIISISTRIIVCCLTTSLLFLTVTSYVDNYLFLFIVSCCCGMACGTLCVSVIAYAQCFSQSLSIYSIFKCLIHHQIHSNYSNCMQCYIDMFKLRLLANPYQH